MVTPLPRRRPCVVARQAVSLDELSGGRLTLGVGIGDPVEQEFGYFGEKLSAKTRAEMLDEGLNVMTGLWTGAPFRYEGKHYRLKEMIFKPTPLQSPRIPIWVAGAWPNKAPFRRAARWDGVYPVRWESPLGPDDLREIAAYIGRYRTSNGRFDVVHGGATPGDDLEKAVNIVSPFAEAGVTWWVEDLGPERFRPFTYDSSYVWPVEEMRQRIRQGPPKLERKG